MLFCAMYSLPSLFRVLIVHELKATFPDDLTAGGKLIDWFSRAIKWRFLVGAKSSPVLV